MVLEGRGIRITKRARARITDCTDLGQIAWSGAKPIETTGVLPNQGTSQQSLRRWNLGGGFLIATRAVA